jgi:hypothetical protein
MSNPWANIGMPEQVRILRLMYNATAQGLVAEVLTHIEPGKGLAVKRLYYRSVDASRYRPVPSASTLVTHEDGASCAAAAFVIYNELRFRTAESDVDSGAADWLALRRFDLVTGVSDSSVDAECLCVPAPYVAGWISQIMSAWPDGDGAVCTVGLERPPDINQKVVVDYYVYDVSFKEGLRRQITPLPHIHL